MSTVLIQPCSFGRARAKRARQSARNSTVEHNRTRAQVCCRWAHECPRVA